MCELFIYVFIILLWFIDGIIVIFFSNDDNIESLRRTYLVTWITLIAVLICSFIRIYLPQIL